MLTKTIAATLLAAATLLPVVARADVIGAKEIRPDVINDIAAGSSIPDAMLKAMRAGESTDAVLRQMISRDASLALPAITAAITLNPDQAANIVSTGLDRRFNLAPLQVVGAALEAAPERSAVIVSTAIVRSPSYYATPIVLRAAGAGINGRDFMPQALRAAPQQADAMLTQVLRASPYQHGAIMKAVIADQPQLAARFISVGLGATKNVGAQAMLQSGFEVVPGQAKDLIILARSAGVSDLEISSACQRAGLAADVCGDQDAVCRTTAEHKPVSGLLAGVMTPASGKPGEKPKQAKGLFPKLDGRFNVTPLAGYRVFPEDRHIDDGAALAVSIGYRYEAPFMVEARIAGARDDAYLVTLNGLYTFGGNERWSPFVMGQLGSSNFRDDHGFTERLAVGVGGGVFYKLSNFLRLRAEISAVGYGGGTNSPDFVGLLGVELGQGQKR